MSSGVNNRETGLSLIEVMVALFVLAIGILGIVGLQLLAKQNNYDAYQRTTAAASVSSMLERMRANPTALQAYVASFEPVPDTLIPVLCAPGECSAEQLAASDIQHWMSMLTGHAEQNLDASLTGGLLVPSACITQNALNENEYRVAIAWRGRSTLTDPADDACGIDIESKPYGENNEFRRVMWVDAHIE